MGHFTALEQYCGRKSKRNHGIMQQSMLSGGIPKDCYIFVYRLKRLYKSEKRNQNEKRNFKKKSYRHYGGNLHVGTYGMR